MKTMYALTAALLFIWPTGVTGADCPDFVKKEQVSTGNQSSLPSGFFVYTDESQSRIYKSPIGEFAPEVIPNTETRDEIENIEISDDGRWVVYTDGSTTNEGENDQKVYLIKIDGSEKTLVPTKPYDQTKFRYLQEAGFYRSSPYGTEIFYLKRNTAAGAIQVDLSGDTPQFGDDRIIIDNEEGEQCFKYSKNLAYGAGQFGVAANHIVSRFFNFTAWFTIPDGGRGVASTCTRFEVKGRMRNGCAETISHDGTITVSNPGIYDDSYGDCIPMDNSTPEMDHKGFIVTPFYENSVTGIWANDFISNHQVSVNWCPTKYRFGSNGDMEFHEYYFTNHNEYLICVQRGGQAPDKGSWMVHWPSNTWYWLTGGISEYHDSPAAFLNDVPTTSLRQQLRRAPRASRTAGRAEAVYNLMGRRIRSGLSGAHARPLPRGTYLVKNGDGVTIQLITDK